MLLIIADGGAAPVVVTSWAGRENSVDWIPVPRLSAQRSWRVPIREANSITRNSRQSSGDVSDVGIAGQGHREGSTVGRKHGLGSRRSQFVVDSQGRESSEACEQICGPFGAHMIFERLLMFSCILDLMRICKDRSFFPA